MQTIEIRGLTKRFKRLRAVDQLDLTLEKGKIYGLLGRNGAGKSTLLNLISGRLRPTSGAILFDGREKATPADYQALYHASSENLLPPSMKVRDIFRMTQTYFPSFDTEGAMADARHFDLDVNQKFHKLSTGYASITKTILALRTHADFLFLDEPTLGHDAVNREVFYRRVLEQFAEDQNTIVLSSHLINELSPLVEEVLFIDHGKLLLQESAESLLARHCRISGPVETLRAALDGERVLKTEQVGALMQAIVAAPEEELRRKMNLQEVEITAVDLQELFIAITGTAAREQGVRK